VVDEVAEAAWNSGPPVLDSKRRNHYDDRQSGFELPSVVHWGQAYRIQFCRVGDFTIEADTTGGRIQFCKPDP
jgi:hypothetical protein